MKERTKWIAVVVYAMAMAWLESAVVFYLRKWSDRINPYHTEPLPMLAGLGAVEMVREAATLIMLVMVGFLAGTTRRSRWGYSAIAFGVWDIFYYVFLKIITGWPHSLVDWDILFLLPLPWWGPVIAPVLISLLMIFWGTLASQFAGDTSRHFFTEWKAWGLNIAGMLLALYVFMKDTMEVAGKGQHAIRMLLPMRFDWPLFVVALGLMCFPVLERLYRIKTLASRQSREDATSPDMEKNRKEYSLE